MNKLLDQSTDDVLHPASIIVEIKTVYGKEVIYPACDRSKLLAKLLGQKSFTRENIEHIQLMGFSVGVQTYDVIVRGIFN